MNIGTATGKMLATTSIGSNRFPVLAPAKATYPVITYQIMPGEGPLATHDTVGSSPFAGKMFHRVRIQFTVWSLKYVEVEALAEELIRLIHGFKGKWGDVAIGSCLVIGFMDMPQQTVTNLFQRVIDAAVQFTSEVAA